MVNTSTMDEDRYQIDGIQQVGISVEDLETSKKWCRRTFGMDIPIFQDKAEARLMKSYIRDEVHSRHAVLTMNMQGGAGFEIWQFTSRKLQPFLGTVTWGDLGIFAVKIRTRDVRKSREWLKEFGAYMLSPILKHPDGTQSFFIRAPFSKVFPIHESDYWFNSGKHLPGGVMGGCIGVRDLEHSLS